MATFNVQIYNARGGEMASMPRAKLKKSPAIVYGKTAKERTWTFVGKLRKVHAGYEEDGQGGYAGHQVTIIVDGVIVTGLADGDFLTADHDTDDTTAVEGADSYVATSDVPAVRLGTIEVKLMQTSRANNSLAVITGASGS